MAREHQQMTGQTLRLPRLAGPVREFVATQSSSAVVLLAATVAALVWANSPWSASYEDFWDTELAIRFGDAELSLDLRHWINDGLMAFFFFVVGPRDPPRVRHGRAARAAPGRDARRRRGRRDGRARR